MSEQPPMNTSGDDYFNPGLYLPPDYPGHGAPPRPPFSKQAIWGFVVATVSLFFFGFLGILGTILCARALKEARAGTARGRGLAIAGLIIGAASAILYMLTLAMRHG